MKQYLYIFFFLFFVSSVSALGLGVSPNVLVFNSSLEHKQLFLFNPNDVSLSYSLKTTTPEVLSFDRLTGSIEPGEYVQINVLFTDVFLNTSLESFILVEATSDLENSSLGIFPGVGVKVLFPEIRNHSYVSAQKVDFITPLVSKTNYTFFIIIGVLVFCLIFFLLQRKNLP